MAKRFKKRFSVSNLKPSWMMMCRKANLINPLTNNNKNLKKSTWKELRKKMIRNVIPNTNIISLLNDSFNTLIQTNTISNQYTRIIRLVIIRVSIVTIRIILIFMFLSQTNCNKFMALHWRNHNNNSKINGNLQIRIKTIFLSSATVMFSSKIKTSKIRICRNITKFLR